MLNSFGLAVFAVTSPPVRLAPLETIGMSLQQLGVFTFQL